VAGMNFEILDKMQFHNLPFSLFPNYLRKFNWSWLS